MEKDIYKKHLTSYLDTLILDIEQIKSIELPSFQRLFIDCKLIDGLAYYDDCLKELKKTGLNESSSVLYYFSFVNSVDLSSMVEKIKKYKKAPKSGKRYLALPKINLYSYSDSNLVLYVGKTNSNFPSRLKHHFGLVPTQTYALQLKHWACDLGLELNLNYAVLNFNKEKIRHLEQMETALHHGLKPILGRAGH